MNLIIFSLLVTPISAFSFFVLSHDPREREREPTRPYFLQKDIHAYWRTTTTHVIRKCSEAGPRVSKSQTLSSRCTAAHRRPERAISLTSDGANLIRAEVIRFSLLSPSPNTPPSTSCRPLLPLSLSLTYCPYLSFTLRIDTPLNLRTEKGKPTKSW